jgi:hypothetical protein
MIIIIIVVVVVCIVVGIVFWIRCRKSKKQSKVFDTEAVATERTMNDAGIDGKTEAVITEGKPDAVTKGGKHKEDI